jgi:hypothetical protein
MKLYHSIERKPQPTVIEEIVGEGGSEAAIVYTAPYFAKENYTRLDKFSYFRNEDAEIDTAGVLSVLPTATVDNTRLAITNNTEVSPAVLQNAANFFAEKLQATQRVLPVSAGWISVTFGNGVFVAVAQSSSIAATSPDGITWTQRVLPVSASWYSVTFGNGVFVAVARYSSIAVTSPDGITWTQRVLPVSVEWFSVTFGNGVFVAVAQSSSIAATSPDGITWTQRVLPASAGWISVTFGNGVFVAVASGSSIAATSPDGVTWTQRVLPASTGWLSVTFGNGVFVAVAYLSSTAATLLQDPTNRITETPALTLPANHSYFVKIT